MQDREGQRLGNYRLVRPLGKGAFAQVYLGEHLYLKNYAAIKVLLASLTEEDERLFLSEAQMIAQLTHPNIVHVYDFAIEHGTPFLAMDYAPGGTLRTRHPKRSCLPLDLTVSYVKQIAAALQHAHNHGIVHRDVKPENVLQGLGQLLLLSDFGISLHLPSADVSNSQSWAGTLPYMAPEQMAGKAVYASDQYSLAIMAYECLCGVRPFEGNSLSLAYQHAQVPPPPLRSHDPSLPEAVERVLQKALAKDPQERYTSVITFARALERACQENTPDQVEGSRTDAPEALIRANTQHIFLSHATDDDVSSLAADLRARTFVVTDHNPVEFADKILPVQSQDEETIRQAIRAAQVVLLVISPRIRSSTQVREHLRICNIYRRPILGFWVTGERIEDLLAAGVTFTDLIDARGPRYKHALDEIMALLEHHYSGGSLAEQMLVAPDFEPRNPYKGLQPFTRTDRGDFFGRETLIRGMISRLQDLLQPVSAGSLANRMLTIVGPSGSGKSSSVMAGLLPRLLEGAISGSESWTYPDPLLPGLHPLDALAQSIATCIPDERMQMVHDALDRPDGLGLHQLALSISRNGTRIVLLIDQLEELFSSDVAEVERQQFIKLLVTAATEPQGPVVVLLTLRADFYDRPFAYPDLGRLIQYNQCAVLPMEIEDLRAIIERPALLPDVRLVFEQDLVGDLLYEIRNQPGTLPLLEFTLSQLFEHRRGHYLTCHAYQEIGGVRGALAKHAEATYASLPSDEHRQLARVLFTRLLQPGGIGQDPIRRRAALEEFTLENGEQTQILSQTIGTFLAARLLTTNTTKGVTTLEVGHEALLCEWPRLVDWARKSDTDIRLQQTISSDVAQWEQRGRPKDRLYRGTRLKEVQAWSQRNTTSGSEAAFLRASKNRRTRGHIYLLIVACLILGLLFPASLLVQQRLFPLTVNTLQDGGPGSLRQAIGAALPGSTISFAPGLKGSISLTTGLEITNMNVTIHGPGAGLLTINGVGNADWSISIHEGASATISGLAFRQPKTASGVFFINYGSLTLDKCTISNITKIKHTPSNLVNASAINNTRGTLTIQNSSITRNTIITDTDAAGTIFNGGGTVIIKNSQVADNTLQTESSAAINGLTIKGIQIGGNSLGGVAMVSYNGKVTLTNSTVSGNKITGQALRAIAGGIYSEQGTLTLTNSTVTNNSINSSNPNSIESGGGIHATNTTTILTNSHVTNNSLVAHKGAFGGGIATNGGSLTLTNSTVLNNSVSGGDDTTIGGGIRGLDSNIKLSNSQVANNTVTSNVRSVGGGIEVEKVPLLLDGSTITNNTITAPNVHGGGVTSFYGGRLTIRGTTISSNMAKGAQGISDGGGISDRDTLSISNSIVSNNTLLSTSPTVGGAVGGGISVSGTIALNNSTVSGNKVSNSNGVAIGGGIATIPQDSNASGTFNLTNCTIFDNISSGSKSSYGGGIQAEGVHGIINFCTIYGNSTSTKGGGLGSGLSSSAGQANIELKNSLIANNSASIGPDTVGTLTTGGYNMIQRFSDTTWSDPENKHTTDLSGNNFPTLGIDPHLRTSNNTAMPTLALLPNSPLLNLVPVSSCDVPTDQRGVKRPQQNACDIGAYEYAP